MNEVKSEIENFLEKEIAEALKIYEKEMFPDEHSIFKELHSLMEDKKEDHNCIGCNLDEYTILTYSTLMLLGGYVTVQDQMRMLLITMYLLVERIDTVLGIINLHEDYRKKSFKTLNKIRKWANFIKHPKAFILAHHPFHSIEGFDLNPELRENANTVINTPFILKYYSNDEKNKELFKTIENKEGILVIFPNPVNLVKKFCEELKLFNRLLKNNEIYREILKEKSTFLGFWINENDEEEEE